MKKYAIFLAVALLLGIFAGCQPSSKTLSNDPAKSTEEQQTMNTNVSEPSEPSIPAEELQALNADILEAFCQMAGEVVAEVADQLSVRHYWHQEDTYAVYIDGLGEYEQALTSVLIYSKEWLFPTTQPLYVYYEGSCKELKEALASGSKMGMRMETMTAFHEYHTTKNSKLYDPENWPEKAELSCPALLTSQKRVQIEAAFGWEFFGTDVWWFSLENRVALRYYGTYNGYDVLFELGVAQAVSTQVIADSTFRNSSSFRLFAHKDGEFFELAELFGDGLVSREDIAKIAQLHNQTQEAIYGEDWDS